MYLTNDAVYLFDKKYLFQSRYVTKISKDGLYILDHGMTDDDWKEISSIESCGDGR